MANLRMLKDGESFHEPRPAPALTPGMPPHSRDRLLQLLRQLGELTGAGGQQRDTDIESTVLEALVDEAVAQLRHLLTAGYADSLVGPDAQHDPLESRYEQRADGALQVQRALAQLRAVGSTAKMLVKAPRLLCECCGFASAILFRVDQGIVTPAAAYSTTDADLAEKVRRQFAKLGRVELDELVVETEMLRRRIPIIVHDAMNDPRTRQDMIRVTGVNSYVAAPILPQGRVIGFLHATTTQDITGADRDVLWAFAEGYGYALERTILLERLHQQGERIRDLVRATELALAEIREAGLQISPPATGLTPAAAEPIRSAVFAAPDSRIHQVLTRRELEIIELIAHGETNREIAERMVISEGTVKTHVSRILRKLRVANRAEAASQFMRLTGWTQPPRDD
ncbi:LuxR C-terminal-related transcriptional regulator [Mycolicibacterium holsaticum]|uniref:LuxR C-terminal-related transcriptional regulator n=1 Tax=Mycolicibacterium holsaticum TaxID=152142 RepID=UPI001C7CD8D8|nr:LuxR C-terminal-related transcriptional regulator [Mycolicibacterium holsaticum]QZA11750.1 LuxR C-terminal-related transcriptional regulator [Mycolicibacterium holsaticum DSM 44478 = JCM 12374]UNC10764.1 GAF domain-containing protein [Mycolicibacterium holsaticum DSM 44478 = JCM 12374]